MGSWHAKRRAGTQTRRPLPPRLLFCSLAKGQQRVKVIVLCIQTTKSALVMNSLGGVWWAGLLNLAVRGFRSTIPSPVPPPRLSSASLFFLFSFLSFRFQLPEQLAVQIWCRLTFNVSSRTRHLTPYRIRILDSHLPHLYPLNHDAASSCM